MTMSAAEFCEGGEAGGLADATTDRAYTVVVDALELHYGRGRRPVRERVQTVERASGAAGDYLFGQSRRVWTSRALALRHPR